MLETLFPTDMPLAVRFGIILVVVVILMAVAITAYVKVRRPKSVYTPPPAPVEIARITENVVFSGGGAFAVVMLILFNVVLTVTYFSVTNILQQNVAMLSWIGWNILWGIGAIIGRRRTYIVHRTMPLQP